MVDPVFGIGPGSIGRPEGIGQGGLGGTQAAGGKSFKDILSDSIAEVNRLQEDANSAITRLQTTGDVDLTHVMVAVEKADLAFKTLMQIRNKLLDAYQQIEGMRI